MAGPVVVLGGTGQLGRALLALLRARGEAVLAPPRSELDLARHGEEIPERIASMRPCAVINAAGFTDVAGAELEEHRDELFRLNRDAPEQLARAAGMLEVPFAHVSTDYVFDGAGTRPYREGDPTGPLQAYGRSKLLGEQAVASANPFALIARTSTLYGRGRTGRPHYVDAILAQARERDALDVVRLPISSPTYAMDLAEGLLGLLRVEARGIVHVVNDGACSRLELARESVRLAGLDRRVEVRERPAPPGDLSRPPYSVLDTSRLAELTGARLRSWQEALADYVRGAAG